MTKEIELYLNDLLTSGQTDPLRTIHTNTGQLDRWGIPWVMLKQGESAEGIPEGTLVIREEPEND